LVLLFDTQVLNLVQLLLLDRLHLETVILQLLAHLLAFLQVVKAFLLLQGFVLGNLVSHHIGVVAELLLLLIFEVTLTLLVLLLSLDDSQEVVTLGLGLGSVGRFALLELALASILELSCLTLELLLFSKLLSAGLALTFLEGTLGTESVNFGLAICGLLLHLAKAGNLSLLLFLEAALLKGGSNFALDLGLVVCNNLLLLLDLALSNLGLLSESNLVGGLNLGDEAQVLFALLFSGTDISKALVFNLLGHLLLLLDLHFLLLDTLDLTLLDLVDNDERTLAAGLHADLLALLLNLEALEAFYLHHKIEFLLLFEPLLLELAVLFELLVADRNDF